MLCIAYLLNYLNSLYYQFEFFFLMYLSGYVGSQLQHAGLHGIMQDLSLQHTDSPVTARGVQLWCVGSVVQQLQHMGSLVVVYGLQSTW